MELLEQLFEGERIIFTAIDLEKDPEIESGWTQDSEYLRLIEFGPARPLTPAQVKKKYEAIEKESDEAKSLFYFAVRTKEDERLIGFARIDSVIWSNGTAFIRVGVGNLEDRQKGYAEDILRLLLRYAFSELNLFRVSAVLPAYDEIGLELHQKLGFVQEVRRRKAIQRDGQFWDLIHLGLLQEEWNAQMGSEK